MVRKLKRRLREALTRDEYEAHAEESVLEAALIARADEELFVIDRSGASSNNKRIKKHKEEVLISQGSYISQTEKKLIERTIRKPRFSSQQVNPSELCKAKDKTVSTIGSDLWQDTADVGIVDDFAQPDDRKEGKGQRKRLNKPNAHMRNNHRSVCSSGLSYNPSIEDHQQALAESLALEIKHEQEHSQQLVQKQVSITAESDASPKFDDADASDEDDSDAASYDGNELSKTLRTKQRERFTRAQRNKIRTRKLAENLAKQTAGEKKFLKSIDHELPTLLKSMKKEEANAKVRRSLREHEKQQKELERQQRSQQLLYEEASAVPLSDELNGSLRSLIPKGASLQLQQVAMRKNGDAADPRRRGRRAYEKPHGSKKIVWLPKYKVTNSV